MLCNHAILQICLNASKLTDLVPSRNSPWYLFSDEFHQNLKDGQSFEIMMTFSVCILSIAILGFMLCLKYYCCRNLTISAAIAWVWHHLPNMHLPVVTPSSRQDSPVPQRSAASDRAIPMQVLSRNYQAMPPRRDRGTSTGRQGHFEIVFTPARDPQGPQRPQRHFEEL